MRTGKRFTIGVLPTLLVLMAMFIAACGGGGSSNSSSSSQPSHAPASQQIFKYPLAVTDISTFDPALVQDAYSGTAIEAVFTGLVSLDANLNVKPQMATSWDKSSDGLTWTFHLKSGLQFSDGTAINANDVAYSINRALAKATQSPVALTYLGLIKDSDKMNAGSISTLIGDSLIVQDPNTLVIKLNKAGAFFLEAMTYPTSYVVEKKLIDKYSTKWTDHLTEGGGSGPFKVSVYSHSKGITLVPNSTYYGSKPQLQQLQFPFYADTDTVYQAYQANQLDYTNIPAAHFASDKTLATFHKVPQLYISYFGMNYLTKPFDNIKIRQALDLALDKDVIVHSVLKDRFFATNHIVPQGQPGYNPNLTGPDGATTHGNPAMAKQLLQQGMQEEGWSSISQIPTIKATYPATSADAKNAVAAMVQRWQTVLNLNVIANPEDFNKELDDINAATNNPKGIQMWRIAWIADYPDPQDWTTLQFDKGSPNNNANYGQNQSTNAAEQQQVQQQLEQADVMQDPTARLKTYNDLEQKLVNDVAWLPLYQVNDLYLLKSYVQGYSENPEGLNPPDSWSQVYIASH
jgi:peptide/nickel transport system substrate-binding protein/oligopeptide transport system substrate-binding protein